MRQTFAFCLHHLSKCDAEVCIISIFFKHIYISVSGCDLAPDNGEVVRGIEVTKRCALPVQGLHLQALLQAA